MKHLLFACLLLGFLRAAAWCDVILPNRTTITVANLAASPGFKFSYSTDPENQPQKFVPLRETQDIWGSHAIHLFVEDSSGERFEWAWVQANSRAKTAAFSILEVRRDGKTIKVNYKVKPEPAAGGKSARDGASLTVPFMLSGFSLGAVVLLMRRKRAPSARG